MHISKRLIGLVHKPHHNVRRAAMPCSDALHSSLRHQPCRHFSMLNRALMHIVSPPCNQQMESDGLAGEIFGRMAG